MNGKDQEALKLASAHYDVEPGMLQIFRIRGAAAAESAHEEPIKLLEVNENTIAAGIMPLQFAALPDHGIFHSCISVEVTPDECESSHNCEVGLPNWWQS